jgi:tetratricopeptide (TPR) repeat protein
MGLQKYEQATEHFRTGLAIADEIGDVNITLQALVGKSALALVLRQPEEAKRLSGDCLAIAREVGALREHTRALAGLGCAALALGQDQQARKCFCQALGATMEGRTHAAASALVGLATLLSGQGELNRAAELLDWSSTT